MPQYTQIGCVPFTSQQQGISTTYHTTQQVAAPPTDVVQMAAQTTGIPQTIDVIQNITLDDIRQQPFDPNCLKVVPAPTGGFNIQQVVTHTVVLQQHQQQQPQQTVAMAVPFDHQYSSPSPGLPDTQDDSAAIATTNQQSAQMGQIGKITALVFSYSYLCITDKS